MWKRTVVKIMLNDFNYQTLPYRYVVVSYTGRWKRIDTIVLIFHLFFHLFQWINKRMEFYK